MRGPAMTIAFAVIRTMTLAALSSLFVMIAPAAAQDVTPNLDPDGPSLEDVARNIGASGGEFAARDLVALQFYADWCAKCRVLDPKLRDAANYFSDAKVDIIVLDFTKRGQVNMGRPTRQGGKMGRRRRPL